MIEQHFSEATKSKLAEHLSNQVIEGLSGRNREDLVGLAPVRHIFAGVLQPLRGGLNTNASPDTPIHTSIGLDCRLRPKPREKIKLRITPAWSVYYSVVPSLAQVRSASDPQTAASQSGQTNRPILIPIVFRRCETSTSIIEVEIPENRQVQRIDLANLVSDQVARIAADPATWTGGPDPHNDLRQIQSEATASDEAYDSASARMRGGQVSTPPWSLELQVHSEPDPLIPNECRIRILLCNRTPAASVYTRFEERSIFDASITVDIQGGELIPFEFALAPEDYRHHPTLAARGIHCSARWEPEAHRLQTDSLPRFRQPLYRTTERLEITFGDLIANPLTALGRIEDEMSAYLKQWDHFIANDMPATWSDVEKNECRQDRARFAEEVHRFQTGCECLRRDLRLQRAFCFMNRAFGMLAEQSAGKLKAWRLFQIAFIVSQLPALAVRMLRSEPGDAYSAALKAQLEEVDILWFPTGGGKTEAYLGLLAVAMLYDRLRGKTRGVCAWMRFPLRMLSLQQLERLARLVAQLNVLRAMELELQNGDPFAIGYFIGSTVTPNRIPPELMQELERNNEMRQKFILLRKCPFCGAAVRIEALRPQWRLAHVCSNHQCFSNTDSHLGRFRGSLPICIVDNEIYRYLPSVLVGTVDKLAIAGINANFVHIVRGVIQECPEHGYCSYGVCLETKAHTRKPRLARLTPIEDPGPSLLVQDELHLLKAELGVFNGHYEGLLRYLGRKIFLPAKVLAATATIEAYDMHAFHIYLSRARRFPQPGWEAGESFYATSQPRASRRNYIGVPYHTRGVEEVATRCIALYVRSLRRLQADLQALRDVIGEPQATETELRALLRLYDFSLAYVSQKATGSSIVEGQEKIERFLKLHGMGSAEAQNLTAEMTSAEIGSRLERIELELDDTGAKRLDYVAATSLISHGVDLERINFLVMSGIPSHYAEYVQTSSRAARSHPGTVFTCFKATDPRELSQYELFTAMHENLERLIEPVAVNRFASFAPQKTVPGLLRALLLADATPELFGSRIHKPLDHIPTLLTALNLRPGDAQTQAGCLSQQDLIAALEACIGVDRVRLPALPAEVENARGHIHRVFEDLIAEIARSHERYLSDILHPMTSFRDVDEGVGFSNLDSSDLVARLASE